MIGSIVALGTLALAIGAVSGRVRVQSCCTPVPADHDLRMHLAEGPVPSEHTTCSRSRS